MPKNLPDHCFNNSSCSCDKVWIRVSKTWIGSQFQRDLVPLIMDTWSLILIAKPRVSGLWQGVVANNGRHHKDTHYDEIGIYTYMYKKHGHPSRFKCSHSWGTTYLITSWEWVSSSPLTSYNLLPLTFVSKTWNNDSLALELVTEWDVFPFDPTVKSVCWVGSADNKATYVPASTWMLIRESTNTIVENLIIALTHIHNTSS